MSTVSLGLYTLDPRLILPFVTAGAEQVITEHEQEEKIFLLLLFVVYLSLCDIQGFKVPIWRVHEFV